MDRLCISCACKIIPTSSTLLSNVPSLEDIAALDAYQPSVLFGDLEAAHDDSQTAQFPWNIEDSWSTKLWQDCPTLTGSSLRSPRFPANNHVPYGEDLGRKEDYLDIPASPSYGVIGTSRPPSLSARMPTTSSSGDYRCYQHGCGGRRFSSSENYRRHMRERSRSDATICPFCSTLFTRKSNRDNHVRKRRCKGWNKVSSERVDALSSTQLTNVRLKDSTKPLT
ncbi:hypothetical protein IG631_20656 [Alternaria alternata]|nr:hypothetical protein IG631_20656 [Alternaria alternata]